MRVITNHGDQNSNKKKRGRVSRPSRQQAAWYGSTDIQLKSTPLLVSTRLLCKQGKTTVRAGQDYCASRTRPLCEQDKTTVRAGQDYCASRTRPLCKQDKTTVRAGQDYCASRTRLLCEQETLTASSVAILILRSTLGVVYFLLAVLLQY